MIVAGLQMDIAWEDPDTSFGRAASLAERAAADGARLVALPEMFASGFTMRAAEMAAHGDATRRFLAGLARRLGLWVLGGYVEPAGPRPYNACTLFDPAGAERLHYRKIHPFTLAGEERHYAAGDTVGTAEVEGLRVTPLICYDLRFVEPFRAAAERTDLYVVIANWPNRRHHAWATLLRARAIDCQAWVLGVNRVGEASGARHDGGTALVDPLGHAVSELMHVPGVVRGHADPAVVRDLRDRYPFLRDRRPDLYPTL